MVGERAAGLSANVVVRLKDQWCDEYEQWSKRDLSGKHYVYVWADGIHAKVRLEDGERGRDGHGSQTSSFIRLLTSATSRCWMRLIST